MRKFLTVLLILVIGAFVLIQLFPYGRNHRNPPITNEPLWDNTEARALAVRACYDCHSNETQWPWYSNIAPFSWLVQNDVNEGRRALNFSEWGSSRGDGEEVEEMAEVIIEGEMPLPIYLLLHPEARLSQTEKQTLARSLSRLGGEVGEREDTQSEEEREGDSFEEGEDD